MVNGKRFIDCPEALIEAVRMYGIIPFFKGAVPGWSVEELTAPGCWFDNDGVLGPWDWKIDAVRTGEIAYGKFLGDKAAFATVDYYRDLCNWRRSQPRYRMALGEAYPATSNVDKLMGILAAPALKAIRQTGSLGTKEIALSCAKSLTQDKIALLPPKYGPLLSPRVKSNIVGSVDHFLEMGTWILIGDFERVYRGPNLTYSGWQHASFTTPEALFGIDVSNSSSFATGEPVSKQSGSAPFWAARFAAETGSSESSTASAMTPEESRSRLCDHIKDLFPSATAKQLDKLI